MFWFVLGMSLGSAGWAVAPDLMTSLYTDLSGSCELIESNEEGAHAVYECSGPEGYLLRVRSDDDRESITIITPNKKEFPVNLVASSHYSSVGEKAEWRVLKDGNKTIPIGLIIPVEYRRLDRPQSMMGLAVVKITSEEICLIDTILFSKNQFKQAQKQADNSSDKDCVDPIELK